MYVVIQQITATDTISHTADVDLEGGGSTGSFVGLMKKITNTAKNTGAVGFHPAI